MKYGCLAYSGCANMHMWTPESATSSLLRFSDKVWLKWPWTDAMDMLVQWKHKHDRQVQSFNRMWSASLSGIHHSNPQSPLAIVTRAEFEYTRAEFESHQLVNCTLLQDICLPAARRTTRTTRRIIVLWQRSFTAVHLMHLWDWLRRRPLTKRKR